MVHNNKWGIANDYGYDATYGNLCFNYCNCIDRVVTYMGRDVTSNSGTQAPRILATDYSMIPSVAPMSLRVCWKIRKTSFHGKMDRSWEY